jgi:hypothetical protein
MASAQCRNGKSQVRALQNDRVDRCADAPVRTLVKAAESTAPHSVGRFVDCNHDAKFLRADFERSLPVPRDVLST